MYNIAICGSNDYVSESKVALLIKSIYKKFGQGVNILSGGGENGAEKWVKEYAFEFGLNYIEYNPSFTGHNEYSALPNEYFGKKMHVSHFFDRYLKMLQNTDKLFIFISSNSTIEPELQYLYKKAKERRIKTILIR